MPSHIHSSSQNSQTSHLFSSLCNYIFQGSYNRSYFPKSKNSSAMYLMVLFKIVFLQMILSRMSSFSKFFARCQYFISTWLAGSWNHAEVQVEKSSSHDFESSRRQPSIADAAKKIVVDDGISRDDVESVMERLGLFCHPEGELLQERFGSADVSNLFEEKEPTLDEVKGAFDVFDENRDGFIDAKDLQRVLSALGLDERSEMADCRRMIRLHDENGDGKLDFDEFAKFMETSFC